MSVHARFHWMFGRISKDGSREQFLVDGFTDVLPDDLGAEIQSIMWQEASSINEDDDGCSRTAWYLRYVHLESGGEAARVEVEVLRSVREIRPTGAVIVESVTDEAWPDRRRVTLDVGMPTDGNDSSMRLTMMEWPNRLGRRLEDVLADRFGGSWERETETVMSVTY